MLKLERKKCRRGTSGCNYKEGEPVYVKAIVGDITALIFLAKAQMGWRGTQRIEHSGQMTGEVVVYQVPDNGRD